MTPDTMAAFIESEINKGASENTIRRLKATVKMVYEFLPEDKLLTRERLLEWRTDLNEKGYAYRGLYSIFKKHGFYFEMGDHWDLTCYIDFGQEDMAFICDEPTEPISMEPEDRTFEEWKFLCKLFGLEKADRIVLKNYRIEAHGKWKNKPVKELLSTKE